MHVCVIVLVKLVQVYYTEALFGEGRGGSIVVYGTLCSSILLL